MRAAADVPFYYTETEWSTIERALPSAHLAVPLTEDEKSFLRAIAERFLRPQSERASGRNKLWSELARVCGKAEAYSRS